MVQIPWNDDDELLTAWRDARTGYPWIDAIMVQVRYVAFLFCKCILLPIQNAALLLQPHHMPSLYFYQLVEAVYLKSILICNL